ncbi:MAG TPA: hypothetical protein VFC68_07645 [Treponemataceae bacterium]|nr:hypothetical protein [Treponemataceae bacterium]
MGTIMHTVLQYLSKGFDWITTGPVQLILTLVILAFVSLLVFAARVLPYKKYPKNLKIILPSEIIRMIKGFFITLVVLVLLYIATGLAVSLTTYINKMNRLQELQTVYKNINQDYLLADVSVEKIEQNSTATVLTLAISYYAYGDRKTPAYTEQIILKGDTVYFDCTQYNFAYSLIETGQSQNLALPYRVFSNTIPASDGLTLNPCNKDGVPYIFQRTKNNIFGIQEEDYNKRVIELVGIMNSPEKSQKEGILRSSSGSALSFKAQKKITYRIYASQSGGLTLSKKADWF